MSCQMTSTLNMAASMRLLVYCSMLSSSSHLIAKLTTSRQLLTSFINYDSEFTDVPLHCVYSALAHTSGKVSICMFLRCASNSKAMAVWNVWSCPSEQAPAKLSLYQCLVDEHGKHLQGSAVHDNEARIHDGPNLLQGFQRSCSCMFLQSPKQTYFLR